MRAKIASLLKNDYWAAYAPIFRVFLCLHIIKKSFLLWSSNTVFIQGHRDAIDALYGFRVDNFLLHDFATIPVFVILMIVVSALWMFGYLKYIGPFILSLLLFFQSTVYTELMNGGDNLLFFVVFYMTFINSYDYLSFKKLPTHRYVRMTSNLAGLSILLHLCLVYFISGIHKVHSDVWFNGVATYYIWNIERFSSPIAQLFNKNQAIITLSTYVTILFEIFFPVLIWFRQTRALSIAVGIALHLGIWLTMMIYDFEILFIAIYGFWVPASFWLSLKNKFSNTWVSTKLTSLTRS